MKSLVHRLLREALIQERLNVGSKERIHTSNTEITEIYDTTGKLGVREKPFGFWYGFGDNWKILATKAINRPVTHAYKLYIDKSKICQLITVDDVTRFSQKYVTLDANGRDYFPNWSEVAKDYSGIEIPNYKTDNLRNLHGKDNLKKNHRLYWWLYGWQLESGCIWKPDGLIKLKPLGGGEGIHTPEDPKTKGRRAWDYGVDL